MNKLSAWNTRRGAIAVRLNDGFEAEHPRRQVHLNDGLGQLQPFDRGHEMEAEGRPRRFRGGPVKQSRSWRTQPGALFVYDDPTT